MVLQNFYTTQIAMKGVAFFKFKFLVLKKKKIIPCKDIFQTNFDILEILMLHSDLIGLLKSID